MKFIVAIKQNKLASLWFVFLAITFLASILVLNPTLDPGRSVLSWPQLQLQFAYTPENGMHVLESWGLDAKERYFSVIWIDVLFAFSYGPFFYMLIKKLDGKNTVLIYMPLVEMVTNLIETSMEIYWIGHHSPDNPLFGLFLTHSIIATVKWAMVPIYLWHSLVLVCRAPIWSEPALSGAEVRSHTESVEGLTSNAMSDVS